jgi:hypothetical protein
MMLLWWAACTGGYAPWTYTTCTAETTSLAADVPSALGFSGDDVAAWLGAEVRVDAEWNGRHSDTPPSDQFVVTRGALLEAVFTDYAVSATQTEASCPDTFVVTFEVALTSADGAVSGTGTLSASFLEGAASAPLGPAALDGATFNLEAADATLSDERWAEVQLHLDAGLPPPTSALVALYHAESRFDVAQIIAEGDGYSLAVWKCDEQLADDDCVTWTLTGTGAPSTEAP